MKLMKVSFTTLVYVNFVISYVLLFLDQIHYTACQIPAKSFKYNYVEVHKEHVSLDTSLAVQVVKKHHQTQKHKLQNVSTGFLQTEELDNYLEYT